MRIVVCSTKPYDCEFLDRANRAPGLFYPGGTGGHRCDDSAEYSLFRRGRHVRQRHPATDGAKPAGRNAAPRKP